MNEINLTQEEKEYNAKAFFLAQKLCDAGRKGEELEQFKNDILKLINEALLVSKQSNKPLTANKVYSNFKNIVSLKINNHNKQTGDINGWWWNVNNFLSGSLFDDVCKL